MNKELNKKLLLGAGAAALSVAGALWVKQKTPLTPKVPTVDSSTILLFQFGFSPYCIKVAKIMDYKGIPYRTVNLMPIFNKGFIKEISNQFLVPVIKHKNRTISDSTRIAHYLEEISPEPSIFFKDEPKLDEEVVLLEDWADESLRQPFLRLAIIYLLEHPEYINETDSFDTGIDFIDSKKSKLGPVVAKMMMKNYKVDLNEKDALKKRARGYLDLLLKKLEGKEYLVGDKLTLADIAVASHLTVAQKVPYIAEDELYGPIFEWQAKVFNATKRRYAANIS